MSGDGTMFQAMRELWSPSWLMGHCGLWPRTVASHRGCFQAAAQVARERAQHRASSRLWATWCESAQEVDVDGAGMANGRSFPTATSDA